MIFRRVAILTLAWVLVGFGIDFDAETPTQASQGERPVNATNLQATPIPDLSSIDSQ
jgi:hypothetical protein